MRVPPEQRLVGISRCGLIDNPTNFSNAAEVEGGNSICIVDTLLCRRTVLLCSLRRSRYRYDIFVHLFALLHRTRDVQFRFESVVFQLEI